MKCFLHHKKNNLICSKKQCRYWIEHKKSMNCGLITLKETEKLTLESIGEIFKVTRMRICQLEKLAIKKIKEKIKKPQF